MTIIDPMIQECQHEAANTRKVLERVPDEHFDWKPHEKSFSLGQLAAHLAESLEWIPYVLEKDALELDLATYKPPAVSNRQGILAYFDKQLEAALASMKGKSDDVMLAKWALIVDGNKVFEMPRRDAIRDMSLSHTVHHRGQLTVYLRLLDVPLPAIYGPSADEQ